MEELNNVMEPEMEVITEPTVEQPASNSVGIGSAVKVAAITGVIYGVVVMVAGFATEKLLNVIDAKVKARKAKKAAEKLGINVEDFAKNADNK